MMYSIIVLLFASLEIILVIVIACFDLIYSFDLSFCCVSYLTGLTHLSCSVDLCRSFRRYYGKKGAVTSEASPLCRRRAQGVCKPVGPSPPSANEKRKKKGKRPLVVDIR